MALIVRPWDPPAVEEALVSLPASPVAEERLLLEAPGRFANCDLYVTAPAEWLPVTLILRAKSGPCRVPLLRKRIDASSFTESPNGLLNQFSALVLSVRGRACAGFELAALSLTTNVPEGIFRLECWGHDGSESDQADPPARMLFCEPHQHVDFTSAALAAGLTQALAANPTNGNRVAITHASFTSNNAAVRLVRLIERTSATVRAHWFVTAGAPIIVDLTRPIRSGRGEAWDLDLAAGAGTVTANLYGYNE